MVFHIYDVIQITRFKREAPTSRELFFILEKKSQLLTPGSHTPLIIINIIFDLDWGSEDQLQRPLHNLHHRSQNQTFERNLFDILQCP